MAEKIQLLQGASKKERYVSLIPQIRALVEGEKDETACLANIMAALKYGMDFFWIGCYLVRGQELVLGPFQGPVACSRIPFGKGVCGRAWKEKRVVIISDVDQDPGHIACSSESRSEIVVPVLDSSGKCRMVLDADSDKLADFDETDHHYLLQVAEIIRETLY